MQPNELFDLCPTSLWIDDFSALMRRVEVWREAGVQDFGAWLDAHPDELIGAIGLIVPRKLNPASIAMFGARDAEELLQRMPELFAPETLQVLRDEIVALAGGARRFEGEAAAQTLDGRPLSLLLKLAVPGEPPDYERVLFSLVDVTELEREQAARRDAESEARLQHAQKLESLGVLAGGIAHDFNNLLVGVLGNVELAEMTLPPTAPAIEHLRRAQKAAERAAELCRQLLAYSGKGRFRVEPLDVSAVVDETAELLAVSVPKSVTLNVSLRRGLPAVRADATQLRQVLMNLITNAAEAIEGSGVVSLRTVELHCDAEYLEGLEAREGLEPGRYVAIEVSDTGQGMDAATRARIFEPFFSTKFTGRGLGLAAVLGIVRGHGGALNVYSEPGRGTTMKVLLPALEGEAPVDARPQAQRVGALQGVVLVADDEEAVRAVASQTLRLAGLSVLQAADGIEALDLCRAHADIDVVLLDLTMPRLDGEATFRELRALRPGIRVVLTSGYNEQEVINHFAGKGVAGFLQKPWSARKLLDAVAAELRRG